MGVRPTAQGIDFDIRGPLEVLGPGAVALAAGLATIVDSTSFRLSAVDEAAFVVFVAVALGAAALAWAQIGLPARSAGGVTLFGLLVLIGLVPILGRARLDLSWTLADLLTMVAPAAVFVVAVARPSFVLGRQSLRTVAVTFAVAAAVAATVGAQAGTHRHLPPATLLVAAAWTLALCGTTARVRVAGLSGVGATLWLILHSGNRTSVAIWVVAGLLVALRRFGVGRMLVILAIVMTVTSAWAAVVTDSVSTADLTEGTRFERLQEGSGDESAQARLNEGADIRLNMRDWSARDHLIGAGHGATWVPDRQLGFWQGDIYHAIHLGHLRTWFRYGVLGFVPVLAVLLMALAVYWRSPSRPRSLPEAMPVVVSVSALLLTADFAVRNPMTTASASLTCGWVAALWVLQSSVLLVEDPPAEAPVEAAPAGEAWA